MLGQRMRWQGIAWNQLVVASSRHGTPCTGENEKDFLLVKLLGKGPRASGELRPISPEAFGYSRPREPSKLGLVPK